jgi:hypothetical protein
MRREAVRYGVAIDRIGGVDDHVHILIQLPPKIAAAALVRAIKAKSSKALNDCGAHFAWQEGYGCFSVSMSQLSTVRRYIERQEEHHSKMTFAQEYACMLVKHGFDGGDSPREVPSSSAEREDAQHPGLHPGL